MIVPKIINKDKIIKLKITSYFPDVVLANLQEKNVIPAKETQEIIADEQYDGLSKVTVEPIPSEYVKPNGTLEITENGEYDVREKENVNVNLPTDVMNGIIQEYKAYAESGNIEISANTFIEFVANMDTTLYENAFINVVEKYNDNNDYVCVCMNSGGLFVYIMNFDNGVVIKRRSSSITTKSLSHVAGCYINGNNLFIVFVQHDYYYANFVNVQLDTMTISNLLNPSIKYSTGNKSYCDIILDKVVDGTNYYLVSFTSGSYSYCVECVYISENGNVLIKLADNMYSGTGKNYYIRDIVLKKVGNNNILAFSDDGGFYIYNIMPSDTSINYTKLKSYTSYPKAKTTYYNGKFYIMYNDTTDKTLRMRSITINEDLSIVENNDEVNFNLTNTLYRIYNNDYYLFVLVGTYSFILIDLRTNKMLDKMPFVSLPEYYTIQSLEILEYENSIILFNQVKIGSSRYNRTNIYKIHIDNNKISLVIPSTTKIEGMTKSICTNEQAGDVWVLQR